MNFKKALPFLIIILLSSAILNAQIKADGILVERFWASADKFEINIEDDWCVDILFSHDEQNVYIAFINLVYNDSTEVYPEVLIDTYNDKNESWDDNDWWFHTSYSNCEGKGKYNNYSTCKKGQKAGWFGNNFPLNEPGIVEIKIEKDLIGVFTGQKIGLAFDVTDTQSKWHFYPANAKLESPKTWIEIEL